jgi:hypothetical protein
MLNRMGLRTIQHSSEEGMEMKKRILCVFVLFVFLGPTGSALGAEPIKIGMSTWLGYVPLYLAKEKGFFRKRGVDAEVVVIQSPVDRRAAVAGINSVRNTVYSMSYGLPFSRE